MLVFDTVNPSLTGPAFFPRLSLFFCRPKDLQWVCGRLVNLVSNFSHITQGSFSEFVIDSHFYTHPTLLTVSSRLQFLLSTVDHPPSHTLLVFFFPLPTGLILSTWLVSILLVSPLIYLCPSSSKPQLLSRFDNTSEHTIVGVTEDTSYHCTIFKVSLCLYRSSSCRLPPLFFVTTKLLFVFDTATISKSLVFDTACLN